MRKSALPAILMLAGTPVYAQTAQPVFAGAQMAGTSTTGTGGQTVYVPWIGCTDANNNRISCGGGSSGATNGNTLDVQGTGSLALATANATYSIALSGGRNTVGFTIIGLTGSGATLTAERSNDGGTTWTNANTTESSATSSLSPTLTADGQARVGVAGATNLRLRVSTAGTGTATIAYNATTAAGPVFLTSLLPSTSTPGTNVIGGINNQMVAGVTIATGTGASNTGTQRVVFSTDSSTPANPVYDSTVNGALAVRQGTTNPFVESTTPLAAGASFTGTTVDTGAAGTNPNTVFSCTFRAGGGSGGTGAIAGSSDNFATLFLVASSIVTNATPVTISSAITSRYMRCFYTNGPIAQGNFYAWSSLGSGTPGVYSSGYSNVQQSPVSGTGYAGASGQVLSTIPNVTVVSVNVAAPASAGWAVLYDATTIPADGAIDPTLMRSCQAIATGASLQLQYSSPMLFKNGAAFFISSNSCTTKAAVAYNWLGAQVR